MISAKKISHSDISKAINRFQKKDGIIQKLPDAGRVQRPMIGKDKHQNFESLASFLPW